MIERQGGSGVTVSWDVRLRPAVRFHFHHILQQQPPQWRRQLLLTTQLRWLSASPSLILALCLSLCLFHSFSVWKSASIAQLRRKTDKIAHEPNSSGPNVRTHQNTLPRIECVPVLLYGLEARALNKSQMASLDFVVNRFFMKLFNTNNIDTVKACQEFFSFELPSDQLAKRVVKFESKVNTV